MSSQPQPPDPAQATLLDPRLHRSSDKDVGFVEFIIKVYFKTERFPAGGQMTQHMHSLAVGDKARLPRKPHPAVTWSIWALKPLRLPANAASFPGPKRHEDLQGEWDICRQTDEIAGRGLCHPQSETCWHDCGRKRHHADAAGARCVAGTDTGLRAAGTPGVRLCRCSPRLWRTRLTRQRCCRLCPAFSVSSCP